MSEISKERREELRSEATMGMADVSLTEAEFFGLLDMAGERDHYERQCAEKDRQIAYYRESVCHGDLMYALPGGGATEAISPEKVGYVIDERDDLRALRDKHLDLIGALQDSVTSVTQERDRVRDLLQELRDEYFAQRADADCEGDPLQYVPNEEMQWQARIDEALNGGKS